MKEKKKSIKKVVVKARPSSRSTFDYYTTT